MSRGLTRRRFLAGGLAALAVGGYARGVEPRWLHVRTMRVNLGRRLRAPLRILHLSDFHLSSFVSMRFIAGAIRLGLERRPDVACLTGDFITAWDPRDMSHYAAVLRELSRRLPTFAVLGNHDGGPWSAAHGGDADPSKVERLARDGGLRLLRDEWTAGPGGLAIAGTTDLSSGHATFGSAFEGLDRDAVAATVLLAHNPDSKDFVGDRPWDLMLSGHTHGGQVVVPFLGPPYVPIDDRRFIWGLHRWRDRWIHTTRGVGNLYGIRINCRPEVAILELS